MNFYSLPGVASEMKKMMHFLKFSEHFLPKNGDKKCTGMTQRDGTGREGGGEFRMGNTCTSVADSC